MIKQKGVTEVKESRTSMLKRKGSTMSVVGGEEGMYRKDKYGMIYEASVGGWRKLGVQLEDGSINPVKKMRKKDRRRLKDSVVQEEISRRLQETP